MKQCEGFERRGGAFSFGPPQWIQCKNEAKFIATKKKNEKVPLCPECVQKAKEFIPRQATFSPIRKENR